MKTVDEGITDKIQSMAAVFARPDDILNGIANLEEKELIWIKKIDGVEVIFPTKDLVQAVVEAGFVKTD